MCEVGNETGDVEHKVRRGEMVLEQFYTGPGDVSICKKQNVELPILFLCHIPLYELREFHIFVPGTN
jgi:hypothetical protein